MKVACASLWIVAAGILFGMPPAYGQDGRALFIGKCGSCHKSGGEAPVFAPTKYASTQWDRFFQADKHARKKDISATMTPEEREAINGYLKKHAADSDQPEAIGLH